MFVKMRMERCRDVSNSRFGIAGLEVQHCNWTSHEQNVLLVLYLFFKCVTEFWKPTERKPDNRDPIIDCCNAQFIGVKTFTTSNCFRQ